jgi:hypothetical protein
MLRDAALADMVSNAKPVRARATQRGGEARAWRKLGWLRHQGESVTHANAGPARLDRLALAPGHAPAQGALRRDVTEFQSSLVPARI